MDFLLSVENFIVPPETFNNIRGLYVYNCPNLNIFSVLRSILNTSGNALRFISLSIGTISGTGDDLSYYQFWLLPYDLTQILDMVELITIHSIKDILMMDCRYPIYKEL